MTGEKRLPQLDARLSAAAGYVRPGHVAADIGCDHGKLTVDLLVSGRFPCVVLCISDARRGEGRSGARDAVERDERKAVDKDIAVAACIPC